MICQNLEKYIKFEWFQNWKILRIRKRKREVKKSILIISRSIQQERKESYQYLKKNSISRGEKNIYTQKEINGILQKQQISSVSLDLQFSLAPSKGGKSDQKYFSKILPESQNEINLKQ
ncbi:unnamed protein product [Paramecium octaurelia]|uniref:Uncharacterized protein n=1 Tax=Paramecium octaurelia TaxID=43137 RepID=A0A8S1TDI9_PAROT|nr:unnamed protein product [Paramecium octaurelia]